MAGKVQHVTGKKNTYDMLTERVVFRSCTFVFTNKKVVLNAISFSHYAL